MLTYLTLHVVIEICLLKPTLDFSLRRLTQNWAGTTTNTLRRFVAPLTTFVDNDNYLATISWTVIKIEWSGALLDINVQLGARRLTA